jgi:hypothetical protein
VLPCGCVCCQIASAIGWQPEPSIAHDTGVGNIHTSSVGPFAADRQYEVTGSTAPNLCRLPSRWGWALPCLDLLVDHVSDRLGPDAPPL